MQAEPKSHRIYNYRKTLLPNEYLASLEEGVTEIESAKEKTGLSVGYPGWNLLYYSLLCGLDREREYNNRDRNKYWVFNDYLGAST